MPLYEFACANCGAECEMLQKINEPNPQICPNCGKPALQRVVSNFGTKLPGLESRQEPVSYTHLTLPTILRV